MFKKRQVFLIQNLELFLSLSLWNKRSSHDVFSLKTSLPNTRANNLFSKKANNWGVARFQKQIVLGSHRNNFCFQNARSRFQALFSTHIPSPKWKKMREWSFKTIICLNSLAKNTWGLWPVQGGNIVFRRKNSRKWDGNFLQPDKGASWFTKDSLILSASDTECFQQWNEE